MKTEKHCQRHGPMSHPYCVECYKDDLAKKKANDRLDRAACSAFRGPIEVYHGTIRVRVDVQREGSEYWARVVYDPVRPDLMPLASGPTRELAIHAACEKASIPPYANCGDTAEGR